MTFADEMIIMDHNSADDTMHILHSLQQEGLPIHLRSFLHTELIHGEIMMGLVREAIRDFDAGIVLPLAADEFLIHTTDDESCRAVLQILDRKQAYQIFLWRYELKSPEEDTSIFLLQRPCVREKVKGSPKMILGRDFVKNTNCKLVQGCHYAYNQSGKLSNEYIPALHLAHYQWRGKAQIYSKVIEGWVSNVARYSVYTMRCSYWGRYFNQILKGQDLCMEMSADQSEPVDLCRVCSLQQLRYTARKPMDVLQNLMKLTENLAENYAEQNLLGKPALVSIIIFAGNDMVHLEKTLNSVLQQTYTSIEIIIIAASDEIKKEIEIYFQNSAMPAAAVHYIVASHLEDALAAVPKMAMGKYIQWLWAGDILLSERTKKLVLSLEADDDIEMVMSNAVNSAELAEQERNYIPAIEYIDYTASERFLSLPSASIWQTVLQTGYFISGGIPAVLFRRASMEACAWLKMAEIGGHVLEILLWEILLKKGLVGIFQDKTVYSANQKSETEYIGQQLAWYYCLEKANIPMDSYVSILERWIRAGRSVKISLGKASRLYNRYADLLETAEEKLQRLDAMGKNKQKGVEDKGDI